MFAFLSKAAAGLFLLASLGAAQELPQETGSCSNLTHTVQQRPDSFFDVWIEISATTPNTPGWLIVGLNDNPTRLELPGQILELGVGDILATPFLGHSDDAGDLARRFVVPPMIATLPLYTQSVNVALQRTKEGRTVDFCLSNVSVIEFR